MQLESDQTEIRIKRYDQNNRHVSVQYNQLSTGLSIGQAHLSL